MNKIDKQILKLLQDNAKIANSDIAKSVGLVPSAILERVRKLEKEGIIQGYETRVAAKKLGIGMTSFVWVDSNEKIGTLEVGKQLGQFVEVQEVHYMTGEMYYLLKVRVKDTDEHADLVEKIGAIAGVIGVRTVLVLKTLKETLTVKIK